MVPIGSVADPLAAETRFAEPPKSWTGCSYQLSSRFSINLFPERQDVIGRTSDGSGRIEPDCAIHSSTPVLQSAGLRADPVCGLIAHCGVDAEFLNGSDSAGRTTRKAR
jgi:hypothetical protein